MAWNEETLMEQKHRFVSLAATGRFTFTELCADFHVSRKTGHKWWKRCRREGTAGLREHSRRPQGCSHQTAGQIQGLIVRLRRRHRTWGPKKLRKLLRRDHGMVRFMAPCRGYRTQTMTIATSLLDRSSFPDHAIAYNLIRALMLKAAFTGQIPVARLSFKGTLDLLMSWAPLATRMRLLRHLNHELIDRIISDLVPFRPGRSEPQARKRRPKNYQFLTKPRHIFRVSSSRSLK